MGDSFLLELSTGGYSYKVVRSKKAKYVRIKISTSGDLSVVIPFSVNICVAHDFVNLKKQWVEKNLLKVKKHIVDPFPDSLDLKLLGEIWDVSYTEGTKKEKALSLKELKSLGPKNHIIEIKGSSSQLKDLSQIQSILNQWCIRKAIFIFNNMLESLAESSGFHYNKLTVRAQKTRWGSCSNKKNISLNCKLLFMPKEVVEYVMIHELCHTIEMNHSSAFWSLVEECDPDFRENKCKLKLLGYQIPT